MEKDERNSQRSERIEKLEELGVKPYARNYHRTHVCSDIVDNWESYSEKEETVSAAGRLKTIRNMGKASFADLVDGSGKIQVYFKKNKLPEGKYDIFKQVDIGDIIGVRGKVFKTRTGEITIFAEDFSLLTKSMRELPEKFHGLRDVEIRYRQRYVDLIANPEVKKLFETRIRVLRHIRNFLDERGFLEVETPMMQSKPGGAAAKPFITHHNALDIDLYMRVAPELYLKRVAVGGFERIFEINRNFRNEGISTKHNPEFTMLELYQAYADYNDMMDITEAIISDTVESVHGNSKIAFQQQELDFSTPWKRIKWFDAFREIGGVDITTSTNKEELLNICKEKNISMDPSLNKGQIIDKLFGLTVEEKLVQPTFIYDYPTEISPLARQHDDDPELTERFELFISAFEVANAFTELTDPAEQLRRFERQQELRDAGDEEAHEIDHDFIRALQYGLPPTGGLGIGIDRLVMILTDSPTIRDVIFFPLLRPESSENA